jgi:hypothetical protein
MWYSDIAMFPQLLELESSKPCHNHERMSHGWFSISTVNMARIARSPLYLWSFSTAVDPTYTLLLWTHYTTTTSNTVNRIEQPAHVLLTISSITPATVARDVHPSLAHLSVQMQDQRPIQAVRLDVRPRIEPTVPSHTETEPRSTKLLLERLLMARNGDFEEPSISSHLIYVYICTWIWYRVRRLRANHHNSNLLSEGYKKKKPRTICTVIWLRLGHVQRYSIIRHVVSSS